MLLSQAVAGLDFEEVVKAHYAALFRFACSLSGCESDACDLTQETFYLLASRAHQLRDATRCKSWLFTTLYREFLKRRRRSVRFPEEDLAKVEAQIPAVTSDSIDQMDVQTVMMAMSQVDEVYRGALSLFYIEDHSYIEIAAILGVPPGTVMSRIARGKEQLRRLLSDAPKTASDAKLTIAPFHD